VTRSRTPPRQKPPATRTTEPGAGRASSPARAVGCSPGWPTRPIWQGHHALRTACRARTSIDRPPAVFSGCGARGPLSHRGDSSARASGVNWPPGQALQGGLRLPGEPSTGRPGREDLRHLPRPCALPSFARLQAGRRRLIAEGCPGRAGKKVYASGRLGAIVRRGCRASHRGPDGDQPTEQSHRPPSQGRAGTRGQFTQPSCTQPLVDELPGLRRPGTAPRDPDQKKACGPGQPEDNSPWSRGDGFRGSRPCRPRAAASPAWAANATPARPAAPGDAGRRRGRDNSGVRERVSSNCVNCPLFRSVPFFAFPQTSV
jgi:hypothetical protein